MVFAVLYLSFCVVTGYVGQKSRLRFWGVFWVALILSPLLALLLVLLFGNRRQTRVVVVPRRRVILKAERRYNAAG
jgi:hypothetical protein